jgi:hypothetical protein
VDGSGASRVAEKLTRDTRVIFRPEKKGFDLACGAQGSKLITLAILLHLLLFHGETTTRQESNRSRNLGVFMTRGMRNNNLDW